MSIFIATLDTRHFSFEAYGNNEDEAKAVLESALRKHAKQYSLQPEWPDAMIDGCEVREVAVGLGYRDREPIV